MSLGLGFLDFCGSASGLVFLLHLEFLTLIYVATLGVSSTTPRWASTLLGTTAPWGVSGIGSDELIPPLRPRGRTGVFHRQRHHRFSDPDPHHAALALQLDFAMRTDPSSVQPADPVGTVSAFPPTATSHTFVHSSVRGVYLS